MRTPPSACIAPAAGQRMLAMPSAISAIWPIWKVGRVHFDAAKSCAQIRRIATALSFFMRVVVLVSKQLGVAACETMLPWVPLQQGPVSSTMRRPFRRRGPWSISIAIGRMWSSWAHSRIRAGVWASARHPANLPDQQLAQRPLHTWHWHCRGRMPCARGRLLACVPE